MPGSSELPRAIELSRETDFSLKKCSGDSWGVGLGPLWKTFSLFELAFQNDLEWNDVLCDLWV